MPSYLEFSVLLFLSTVFCSSGLAAKTCLTCPTTRIPPELCEGDVCNITSLCAPQECTCGGQICNTHFNLIDVTEANSTDVKFNYTVSANCLHQQVLCPGDGHDKPDLTFLYSEEMISGKTTVTVEKLSVLYECGDEDDCNGVVDISELTATLVKVEVDDANQDGDCSSLLISVITGSCLVLILALIAALFIWRMMWVRQKRLDEDFECKLTSGSRLSSDDASLIDVGWEESGGKQNSFSIYKYSSSVATQYTRGSRGNGVNPTEQHLPIELLNIIGKGHFAEVWRAKLIADDMNDADDNHIISVKVFRLRNYGAWRQEKDMLTETWMRHENIIEFYASEQHTVRGKLQYWLVTAYYQQGSLAEFLRNNILDWCQFMDMAISIANGMSYLHSEKDSNGTAKIPIAHRDIKSCNILVKDDCRSCVLADFGLSLKLDPTLTRDELANAGQVGTSRYMAPELLERLVNLTDIELFKRVDVYAMALVLWEMANRCEAEEGMASPYQPVYGDLIKEHPTKQQMLLLVCKDKKQPEIKEKWRKHPGLSHFCTVLSQSMEYDAEARITASCVYERLSSLRHNDDIIDDVDDTDTRLREIVENHTNKAKTEELTQELKEEVNSIV